MNEAILDEKSFEELLANEDLSDDPDNKIFDYLKDFLGLIGMWTPRYFSKQASIQFGMSSNILKQALNKIEKRAVWLVGACMSKKRRSFMVTKTSVPSSKPIGGIESSPQSALDQKSAKMQVGFLLLFIQEIENRIKKLKNSDNADILKPFLTRLVLCKNSLKQVEIKT